MTLRIRLLVLAFAYGLSDGVVLLAESPRDMSPATITRSTFTPVPLRIDDRRQGDNETKSDLLPTASNRSSTAPLMTVGSSLAIVLGLFAAVVWVSRKAAKKSNGNRDIPDEALRILGKKSLGPSGSIALIRCGRSILIVGIHSTGMQRLGEISADEEVRHLEALCNGQSKASFDETLAEMQREPIQRGFIGEEIQRTPASQRQKLFNAT